MNISWEIGVWVAGRAFMNGTEIMDAKDGYQAYPKDGKWTIKDPYTDAILGVPFITVPTGAIYARVMQECLACFAAYNPETSSSFGGKLCKAPANCVHNFNCNSQICDRGDVGWRLMCRFTKKLRLRLKSLCKEAKVDTEYLLLGYEVLDESGGHSRKFGGSTGWLLAHDKEKDEWQLQHHHYPHLTLAMEDKLPMKARFEYSCLGCVILSISIHYISIQFSYYVSNQPGDFGDPGNLGNPTDHPVEVQP